MSQVSWRTMAKGVNFHVAFADVDAIHFDGAGHHRNVGAGCGSFASTCMPYNGNRFAFFYRQTQLVDNGRSVDKNQFQSNFIARFGEFSSWALKINTLADAMVSWQYWPFP